MQVRTWRSWLRTFAGCVLALLGWASGALADHVGGEVTLTGLLSIVRGDDFDNGKQDVFYVIDELQEGKVPEAARRGIRIVYEGEPPPGLETGSIVRVHGKWAAEGVLAVAAADGTGTQVVSGTQVAGAAADQRTIVILLSFNDRALSSSATPSSVADLMFNSSTSVNAWYRWTSIDRVSFSGDVVGPFTINYSYTSTDYYGWASAGDQAATAAGTSLSNYSRKIYVLPSNATGYGGLGTIGGSPSRSWIFVWNSKKIFAHELGHNLGMHHAATATAEYGDGSCVMGSSSGTPSLNGPHKVAMGWLSGQAQNASSGPYTIAALGEPSAQTQVLKLDVPDSTNDYWISYRNQVGFESTLGSGYAYRTAIHSWNGVRSAKTYLEKTLGDGESWTDPTGTFTVSQVANDGLSATVMVTTSVVPIPRAPSVSISPSSQAGAPGTALAYTVNVTNNDNSVSPASKFDLAATLPSSGWQGQWSVSSLTLAPGQSGSAVLTVTSALEPDGSKPIQVRVSDAAQSVHTVNASASYVLDATAPSPATLAATSGSRNVSLSWSGASDGSGSGIVRYHVLRDGVELGTSTTTSFSDSSNLVSGSSYTYWVVAEDRVGNLSADSNRVSLTWSGSTKGGGGGKGGGGKGRP